MFNPPLSELLIVIAVAWIYLTLVRFLDMNEREPVWALGQVFVLGAVGAGAADLLLGSDVLVVPVCGGALGTTRQSRLRQYLARPSQHASGPAPARNFLA